MQKAKHFNNKIYKAIAVLLIIAITSSALLGARVVSFALAKGVDEIELVAAADGSDSGTVANAESAASFDAIDSANVYTTETAVDIFSVKYDNDSGDYTVESAGGTNVLAPGTAGNYNFKVCNTGGVTLSYKMWMESYFTGSTSGYTIPVEVKVTDYDGAYLAGAADSWENVSALNSVEDSGYLYAAHYMGYTLSWQWPFESGDDGADTLLGNLAASGEELTLTVKIYTYAESDQEFTVTTATEGQGTVTGAGTYQYEDSATVTATPADGYVFAGWYDSDSSIITTESEYTFTVLADTDLTAKFTPVSYTVTTQTVGFGTVTGTGAYDYGAVAELTAVPNTGHAFAGWYDSEGNLLSADSSYSFTVTGDTEITVKFYDTFIEDHLTGEDGEIYPEATPDNYQDILDGEDDWNNKTQDEKDAVNEELQEEIGKTYEELLEEAKAYEKAQEFIDDNLTGEDGEVYPEATEDNYQDILNSEDDWNELTDEEKAALDELLEEEIGKTYEELLEEAKAIKDEIDSRGGEETAVYTITVSVEGRGTVSGAGTYESGKKAKLTATAGTGYAFSGWYDENGNLLSAKATYSFTVKADSNITAKFYDTFIEDHLTGDDGEIYPEATPDNYQDILDGEDDWNNKTQDEKDAINDELLDEIGKTYEELLEEAKEYEKAQEFIDDNLTDEDGNPFTDVTPDNYQDILDSEDAWGDLTDGEKAALDELLKEQTGMTYEELLEKAKAYETAQKFINDNLTDDNGNIYTAATSGNWADIIASEDAWNSLSDAEKAALDDLLQNEIGMTYEQLLAQAKALSTDSSAASQGGIPDTSDNFQIAVWAALICLSLGCIIFLLVYKKKDKKSDEQA
ncbi:MAG: InlB B-repeat-containing protein [Clostridiales bacterium]|nr:InlB B-repeat-containing protein [Clostridiales bacterium]